jgi:hypothetical protein
MTNVLKRKLNMEHDHVLDNKRLLDKETDGSYQINMRCFEKATSHIIP